MSSDYAPVDYTCEDCGHKEQLRGFVDYSKCGKCGGKMYGVHASHDELLGDVVSQRCSYYHKLKSSEYERKAMTKNSDEETCFICGHVKSVCPGHTYVLQCYSKDKMHYRNIPIDASVAERLLPLAANQVCGDSSSSTRSTIKCPKCKSEVKVLYPILPVNESIHCVCWNCLMDMGSNKEAG